MPFNCFLWVYVVCTFDILSVGFTDLDAWDMYDSNELEEAGIERDDRVLNDDVPLPNPGPLHEEFYKAIEELASKHESALGDSKSK